MRYFHCRSFIGRSYLYLSRRNGPHLPNPKRIYPRQNVRRWRRLLSLCALYSLCVSKLYNQGYIKVATIKPRPKPKPANKKSNLPTHPLSTTPASSLTSEASTSEGSDTCPVFDPNALPLRCPSLYCKANVPIEPSASLLKLFQRRHALLHLPSTPPLILAKAELEICVMIHNESLRTRYAQQGHTLGYPHRINFAAIPERIESMKSDLEATFLTKKGLKRSEIWKSFTNDVSTPKLMKNFAKNFDLQKQLQDEMRGG
jgi:hypothetical protein